MTNFLKVKLYFIGLILVFSSCEKEEKIDPDIEEVFIENGLGTVGKAGGEVKLDEIKLIIPPNALDEPTEISIVKSDVTSTNDVINLDNKFTLNSNGGIFRAPVQLQIDLSETNAEEPVLMQVYQNKYLQLHESSFNSTNKIFTASLEHFSDWAIQYNVDLKLKEDVTYQYFIYQNFGTIYTGQGLGNENTTQVIESIEGAFNQWEQFLIPAGINFSRTYNENEADIKIISNRNYDVYEHFNFSPFESVDGEIINPVVSLKDQATGNIVVFVSEVEQWLTTKQITSGFEGKYYIERYMTHEIGHILGLQPQHSSNVNATMYPEQKGQKPGALTSDDIKMLADTYNFNLSDLPYGNASKIEIVSDTENSVPKLKSVDFNPTVRVLDDAGNGVPGVPVLFISDPVGIVFNPVGRTDNKGVANCGYWITADSDENQTMLARVGTEEDQNAQFDIEIISAEGYYPKESGTFMDNRDNQEYRWVKIGEQIWMAENLNFGTMIDPRDHTSTYDFPIKYCYDNDENNCEEYGALYPWGTLMNGEGSSNYVPSGIKGICPSGWHIPSDEEWNDLERYLGTEEENIYTQGLNTRGRVGHLLRSTSGWYTEEFMGYQGYDSFGFNVKPAGSKNYWNSNDAFGGLSYHAYFWTSTAYGDASAYDRNFDNAFNILRSGTLGRMGFSVRCVKN